MKKLMVYIGKVRNKMTTRNRKWEKSRSMITIKNTTKAEIEKIGKFGDTYDDVVQKLIKFYKENQNDSSEETKA